MIRQNHKPSRCRIALMTLTCVAGLAALAFAWPADDHRDSSHGRRRRPADVVRTWHALAAAQPANPVRQSRVLAMMHEAMHDAVNGAVPRYETYASSLADTAPCRAPPAPSAAIIASTVAPKRVAPGCVTATACRSGSQRCRWSRPAP